MNKDQKQTLSTTVLMAALMVSTTTAGLVESLTSWMWNYFIYSQALGGLSGCWYIGVWGLFWDNDDGAMIQQCMDIFGGSTVTFPVEYAMNWSK